LFLEGCDLERAGQHFSAIRKYKRAVQLVPDIEYRAFADLRGKEEDMVKPDEISNDNKGEKDEDVDNENVFFDEDLLDKFEKLSSFGGVLCAPEMPTERAHIGHLPTELLVLILKWTVSKELDVASLERASEVCRGFYRAARASDLWRLICFNTWGLNGLPLKCDDWRGLYLKKPRVLLPGWPLRPA